MKRTWKIVGGLLLVGLVSSLVSIGTFAYMNKKVNHENASVFQQNPVKMVGFADAAENTDFTYAAEQSIYGVVHIKSTKRANPNSGNYRYFDPFEFFFGPGSGGGYSMPQQKPSIGFGSGVIISTDGYIITNNHVVEGADELEVITNDNKTYKAKLIGTDTATDIALLKIDAQNLSPIPFGDSDKLKVGEWVLAVGNPFNLTSTVTAGIVSAKGRGNVFPSSGSVSNAPQMKIESFIQTDAAVNPGNSGGALVNIKGELVGINTAIYSQTGNYAGYSFAVPISIAAKVASDLKQYGVVQRAMLGVTISDISALKESDPELTAKLKVTEGVYVAGYSMNSSAKAAGVEIGDVILSVNDIKTKTVSELQEQINRYNPGSKVKILVQRGDSQKTFDVELKNKQGGTDVIKGESGAELLGGAFKELSPEKKKEYGVSFGIEVTGLTKGKLQDVGIKKGFVILLANEQKVSSVEAFEKIIEDVTQQSVDDKGLFIKGFYPDGKMRYYAIDMNE